MTNFLLFAILCISWGSTWVAIKVGVTAVPPLFFAGTRFAAAGLLILAINRFFQGNGGDAVRKRDVGAIVRTSLLVVAVCFSLIFWGEQYVSASVTAVIAQGMIPIFLPYFAFLFGHEQLGVSRVISIVLGLAGLYAIFFPGVHDLVTGLPAEGAFFTEVPGLTAIVLGTLAYCLGSVMARPLLKRCSAIAVAGWQSLLGGGVILFASLVLEMPTRPMEDFLALFVLENFIAWGWLVVVGSAVGFVLYITLLKAWGATRVSPYAFATPVVAIALDYVLFGELIEGNELVGMSIIFVAMAFAFYRPGTVTTDQSSGRAVANEPE